MKEEKGQLAEVFGYPVTDISRETTRHRSNRICPFNNIVVSCTKDKKDDPLGVCSVIHQGKAVAVCPVRLREKWKIAEDAAEFFFSKDTKWTHLPEMQLEDAKEQKIGKIDFVLVSYDKDGLVTGYGGLEVQSVYISGNIRTPFEKFINHPKQYGETDWSKLVHAPHPDFLSSRKRIIPQLYVKSRILRKWGRKMTIAVDESFFGSLPEIEQVSKSSADLLWLVYSLKPTKNGTYELALSKRVYCDLRDSLSSIMDPEVGSEDVFLRSLQAKLTPQIKTSPRTRSK
jgi:hypothetical protein